ncbi:MULTISPECIES: aminotransferase class I/II-fold pyridoxal phosphate-dependent enzyme [Rhodococcus]|uniref:cysteine-S-conjugate beta-lyase n=1 Tax=Rhodococcoides kyotonense TaxID=398843 RepID=A0A177YH74_9NOCA|nr:MULTISPECIES: aminotransferase class I/II-fold pyridoxal phosphate-dependent enzyme [Rhodococcus]NIL78921.1 putative cystathionine beta-lyase [Rhodococcus sp. B10]OAK54650.1 aspartate aminotransferase [Rhodococcus kyotonensis]
MTSADSMETLRKRTSEKWRTHPDDVLPMFVAEMDFPLAPPIRAALHAALDAGDTGYVDPHDASAARAFASYASDVWNWDANPERMGYATDVSVVIVESLRRLIEPGDGVIINPPIYPPFFELVPEAGGRVVEVPLSDDGRQYSLDLDGIDRAFEKGARALLLCSPHNPVGLVHSRETLTELSRIVARHDAVVVSDEIHAPLTHHGTTFTPYLTVSDEAREHGIAAESGSKAFNLAGLKSALFVAESDRMTDLIRGLPDEVDFRAGLLGLMATREGFTHGREWLAATISTIERNFTVLEQQLAEKLPHVTLRRPNATYLAWLDLRGLGWGDDPADRALHHAKLALSDGISFGTEGRGFARMNLACAPDTIVEAIDRLARAL